MPKVYLARHCKTAWNSEGRVQGTMDIELSPEGARAAELNLLAIRELGIQQIICSTAKRALQTATIYPKGLAFLLSLRRSIANWIMVNGKGTGLKIF